MQFSVGLVAVVVAIGWSGFASKHHDARPSAAASTTTAAATTSTTLAASTTTTAATTTTVPPTTTTAPAPTTTTRARTRTTSATTRPATNVTSATTRPPVTTTPTTPPPPPPSSNCSAGASGANSWERDLFTRLNRERAAVGDAALCWDTQRISTTRSHSIAMAHAGSIFHSSFGSGGSGDARYSYGAENVGYVYPGSPGAPATSGLMHVVFMQSAHHRSAILGSGFAVVTIGAYCAPDHKLWVTAQFGRWQSEGAMPGGGYVVRPAANPLAAPDTKTIAC